jgi:endonuclease/exonuclease/phosphatase family metal-dependent hydrolase
MKHLKRTIRAVVAAALALTAAPHEAGAIRVVTWNVFNYPSASLAVRQPHFRTIVDSLHADVIVAQELNSQAGSDSFLTNVLNVVEPGEWTGTWRSLVNEGGSIFWKPAVVTVENVQAVANTNGPRDFLVGRVRPAGYASLNAAFLVYSVHLKAGSAGTDLDTRNLECTQLRNSYLNVVPPAASGGNFMVGGDYNMDNALEGGYQRLTESGADNDGRCKDPLTTAFFWSTSWGNNSGFALGHSQSACLAGCISSTGGLDDRFDLWLTSYSMQDGEGLDYFPSAFADDAYPWQFGNDGQHFNLAADDGGFNNSVGVTVAAALRQTSDHMPVVIVLQVPAKVLADSQLDFGDAIVGGAPAVNLNVANGAAAPADELTYTLVAPVGFTVPGGPFAANAGAPANLHAVGMLTASSGLKSGTLVAMTDDPDSTMKNVLLSGRVLEHSVGSLDSAATDLMTDLDFGEHEIGAFPDSFVRVHNRQLAALQAKLSVDAGVITGGDGRFSIVGGFTGALLGGIGKTYNLHFDDAGATLDSTYTATLTFEVSDEPLPGATPGADLVVNLSATPSSGTTAVLPGILPTALRFYPPRPNPLTAGATFAFDLPAPARVDLAIYDLSGRRVATLASGELVAGRHVEFWNARDTRGGRVPAGIYFASFVTEGMARTARVVVLP